MLGPSHDGPLVRDVGGAAAVAGVGPSEPSRRQPDLAKTWCWGRSPLLCRSLGAAILRVPSFEDGPGTVAATYDHAYSVAASSNQSAR